MEAIRDSARALLAADVSGASGEVGEALAHARRAGERLDLPSGYPSRAVALLAQAERMDGRAADRAARPGRWGDRPNRGRRPYRRVAPPRYGGAAGPRRRLQRRRIAIAPARPETPKPVVAATQPPLARRLSLVDAVVIGLGSMIGAGVFSVFAPAAQAAGAALLIGLGIAAVVAYCNATSSAQLAATYPTSGGTYIYGRERLGAWWGYVAGWGFVVGKIASCAAMALTVVAYVFPLSGSGRWPWARSP